MTGDVSHHRLIARPPGLPGYAPSRWCAVCGKKTTDKPVVHCSASDCPNIVHVNCLGDKTSFDCPEVGDLRTAQGINAQVAYHEPTTSDQQENVVTPDTAPDDDTLSDSFEGPSDDDLLKLQPTELVSIIRNLQGELVKKSKALHLYSSFSNNIGGVRDQVVNVLSFIDKIAASHSSLEDHSVRSIAASARPNRIDDEWLDHVTSNQETQTWWTSSKPKPLLYNTSVLPPGPCPTVAVLPGTSAPAPNATDTEQPNHTSAPEQPGLASVPVQPDPVQPAPTLPGSGHHNPPNHSNIPPPRITKPTNTAQSRRPRTGAPPNRGQTSTNQRQGNTIRKQAPSSSSGAPSTPPAQYCNHCRRRGHTETNCLKKKHCDHCSRKGHTIQECRTKLAEERQEQFLLKISTEQAQSNSIFLQSLSRLLTPSPLQFSAPNPALNTTWTPQSGLLASAHHSSLTNPTSAQPLLNYAGGGAWGFGRQ